MLARMQALLESIYELQIPQRVPDFVVSDPAVLRRLGGSESGPPETLFVRSGADGLDLSLYLDQALLDRLEQHDPMEALDAQNLADFCVALEGVSHFIYVVWCAQHARSVSLLGLEMQAEVDKFTTAALLWDGESEDAAPEEVHRRLFDECRFDARLDAQALTRYRRASHYAGRYCRQLRRHYFDASPRGRPALLRELRRFYRLTHQRKIRHIESRRTH